MSLAYVMPTRDRAGVLARTLDRLGTLPAHDAEVVIADNASAQAPCVPGVLENGLAVRVLPMGENLGAAARNEGARATDADWVVMLDDDSHPMDLGFLAALEEAPADVLAVTADIHLTGRGVRESGGLPEVPVGCGVAYRRRAFVDLGGYDRSFGYYAEEYDLAARLLLAGGRIEFDPRFRVMHAKATQGRDMGLILGRLVRNNGWVMQRYAPDAERRLRLRADRQRYRAIAAREDAMEGFARGLADLRHTRSAQARQPVPTALWDRFTGLSHARAAVRAALQERAFASAGIVAEGKNAWCVRRSLREAGVREVGASTATTLVIGTMIPGPMLDALEQLSAGSRRVVAPWMAAWPIEPARAAA